MTEDPKKLGRKGERLAAEFLKKRGYKILTLNYICKFGEIDIIALQKGILVFVEVKLRSSNNFGPPELSVNKRKRRQIINAAQAYISLKKLKDIDCRFDVIAITCHSDKDEAPEINLLCNAFQADDI